MSVIGNYVTTREFSGKDGDYSERWCVCEVMKCSGCKWAGSYPVCWVKRAKLILDRKAFLGNGFNS